MNPLAQMMASGTEGSAVGSIHNMVEMMKGIQNPQAVLQQVARQNPMMGQVLQLCRGKDPKQVFYQMCRERGVDPDNILRQIR